MIKNIIYQVYKKSKFHKYEEDPKHMTQVTAEMVRFANYRRKYDHFQVWGVQTGWGKPTFYPWKRNHPIITKYFMLPDEAFRVAAHYYAVNGDKNEKL